LARGGTGEPLTYNRCRCSVASHEQGMAVLLFARNFALSRPVAIDDD